MAETKHKTTLEIGVDDRALRELADSMDRALSTKTADAFEKSLDRTSKALGKLVEQQARLLKLQTESAKSSRSSDKAKGERGFAGGLAAGLGMPGFEGGALGPGGRAGSLLGTGMRRGVGGALNGASSLATHAVSGEGSVAGALSAIPFVGPVFGAAYGAAQGFYSSHVAQQTAEAGAYGATGLDRYGAFRGSRYGVMGTELPGLVAEFMGGAQMRGRDAHETFQGALDANKLGGIGLGSAGGIMQAATRLGARQNSTSENLAVLSSALSDGMAAGIHSSRLDQYLQEMTGALDQMQTGGILIAPESMTGMVRTLGTLGGAFRGLAGQQAGLSMTRSLQHAGDRGNLFGMLSLQEAQAAMQERGLEGGYMEARMFMEENPNVLAGRLINRVNGMGGNAGARAYMIQRQFGEMGTTLSAQQAMQLAAMTPEQAAGFTQEGGGDRWNEFMAGQSRAGFGAASAAANLEYQRSTAGGNVAGDMTRIAHEEIRIAGDLLGEITPLLADAARYSGSLLDTFHEGGFGAVMNKVMEDFMNTLTQRLLPAAEEVADTAATGLSITGAQAAQSAGDWATSQLPPGFLQDMVRGLFDALRDAIGGYARNHFQNQIDEGMRHARDAVQLLQGGGAGP